MKKSFVLLALIFFCLACKDKIGVLASLKISDAKGNRTSNQYLVFVKCVTDDAKFNNNPFDTLHTAYRWIDLGDITTSNGYSEDFIVASRVCVGQ